MRKRKKVNKKKGVGRLEFRREEKILKLEIQRLNIKLATLRKLYVEKRENDFNETWGVKRGDRLHIETSHFAYDVCYQGFVFDLEDANLYCTNLLDDCSRGTMRRWISGVVKSVRRIDSKEFANERKVESELEAQSKRVKKKSHNAKRVLGEINDLENE